MSTQIDAALVREYGESIYHLSQQGYQKTSQHSVQGTMNAEGKFFDRVGSVEMYEITDRHGSTRFTDTPHTRRYVTPQQFAIADLVDDADALRSIADWDSQYAKAHAMAMARKKDHVFRDAALGTAKTGKTGTGTQALPAAQIDTTSTSLTFSLVLGCRRGFQEDDIDLEMESPHWAMSPWGIEDLLAEATANGTSGPHHADHFTGRQLQQGEISYAWGFNWHIVSTTNLSAGNDGAGTDSRTFAWVPSGMAFAFNEDMFTSIDVRADLNFSTQVYCRWMGGAVRLEEVKVRAYDINDS